MSLKKTGILKKLDEIKLLPGVFSLVFPLGFSFSESKVKINNMLKNKTEEGQMDEISE